MKITVINGNMRKESNYNCQKLIVDNISKYRKTEVAEFFMPKDCPELCRGCFACILTGEKNCPDYKKINIILETILNSDVVILASPVYAMDVSGGLKSFLDHLCFMWLVHRPNPLMFNKIGVTVSTAAGGGTGHTTKTMRYSLNFWGVKRIFSFKKNVAAAKWRDVSAKNKEKINKNAIKIANKIIKAYDNIEKIHKPMFRKFFFFIMKGMMKKNDYNLYDRNYWIEKGWIKDKSND